MRLSTKARYAVTAMVDVAMEELAGPVPLAAISGRQELPLPYLEQLFGKLRKAGLVKSCRGAMGGYTLAHKAENIPILDIIAAVDTPLKATRCEKDSPTGCRLTGQRCLTHDLWDELGAVVHLFLTRVTLGDVCEGRIAGMGRFGIFMDPTFFKNSDKSQVIA
ncbi:MAG: Rrf2 family transcriptional regulator [Alphaproteobacteria bacterium]|nr:Rrf2 family transcriptional regulator [Alphaproteobacteria bacterium]